jgi:hypothetical protein
MVDLAAFDLDADDVGDSRMTGATTTRLDLGAGLYIAFGRQSDRYGLGSLKLSENDH